MQYISEHSLKLFQSKRRGHSYFYLFSGCLPWQGSPKYNLKKRITKLLVLLDIQPLTLQHCAGSAKIGIMFTSGWGLTQPGQLTQNQPKGYSIPYRVMLSYKCGVGQGESLCFLLLLEAGWSRTLSTLFGPCGSVLLYFRHAEEAFGAGCTINVIVNLLGFGGDCFFAFVFFSALLNCSHPNPRVFPFVF